MARYQMTYFQSTTDVTTQSTPKKSLQSSDYCSRCQVRIHGIGRSRIMLFTAFQAFPIDERLVWNRSYHNIFFHLLRPSDLS